MKRNFSQAMRHGRSFIFHENVNIEKNLNFYFLILVEENFILYGVEKFNFPMKKCTFTILHRKIGENYNEKRTSRTFSKLHA